MTSFAPDEIDEKFVTAKKHFDLFIDQKKQSEENVIARNKAHITVKQPFYLKDGVEEIMLLDTLEGIEFDDIHITASELSVFHTDRFGKVLVALVDKNKKLQVLHEALLQLTSEHILVNRAYEGEAYKPHLSILYDVPFGRIDEAVLYSQRHLMPISYTLDSINLLKAIPNIKKERSFVNTYHVQNP